MGDSPPLRQGIPQGAVLSPLLFLLCIDDLRSVVPETVKVALFADDVSLISRHYYKLVAEKEVQRAVTAVAEWSTSKKMVLNTRSSMSCAQYNLSENTRPLSRSPL